MSLGIVQRLVKLLNARREVGQDSRVPFAHAASHLTAPREADVGLRARQPEARILLVANDPAVLNVSRIWLRSAGYQVTTVLSMADALQQIASDRRIDLLVTDYLLGDEDRHPGDRGSA